VKSSVTKEKYANLKKQLSDIRMALAESRKKEAHAVKNLKLMREQQDQIKVGHVKDTDGLAKAIVKKHGGKLKQKGGKRKEGIKEILGDRDSDSAWDSDDSTKPSATDEGMTLDEKRELNVRRNEKFLESTRLREGLSHRRKQTPKRLPKKKESLICAEDSDSDSSVTSCDNLTDKDDEGIEKKLQEEEVAHTKEVAPVDAKVSNSSCCFLLDSILTVFTFIDRKKWMPRNATMKILSVS
jgi:hypothetical protein